MISILFFTGGRNVGVTSCEVDGGLPVARRRRRRGGSGGRGRNCEPGGRGRRGQVGGMRGGEAWILQMKTGKLL